MADYDLVIRGGTVVDGLGAEGHVADIAVVAGAAVLGIASIRADRAGRRARPAAHGG